MLTNQPTALFVNSHPNPYNVSFAPSCYQTNGSNKDLQTTVNNITQEMNHRNQNIGFGVGVALRKGFASLYTTCANISTLAREMCVDTFTQDNDTGEQASLENDPFDEEMEEDYTPEEGKQRVETLLEDLNLRLNEGKDYVMPTDFASPSITTSILAKRFGLEQTFMDYALCREFLWQPDCKLNGKKYQRDLLPDKRDSTSLNTKGMNARNKVMLDVMRQKADEGNNGHSVGIVGDMHFPAMFKQLQKNNYVLGVSISEKFNCDQDFPSDVSHLQDYCTFREDINNGVTYLRMSNDNLIECEKHPISSLNTKIENALLRYNQNPTVSKLNKPHLTLDEEIFNFVIEWSQHIDKAVINAKSAKKPLLIFVGETHESVNSLLQEMIFLHIIKDKPNFNNLYTEQYPLMAFFGKYHLDSNFDNYFWWAKDWLYTLNQENIKKKHS